MIRALIAAIILAASPAAAELAVLDDTDRYVGDPNALYLFSQAGPVNFFRFPVPLGQSTFNEVQFVTEIEGNLYWARLRPDDGTVATVFPYFTTADCSGPAYLFSGDADGAKAGPHPSSPGYLVPVAGTFQSRTIRSTLGSSGCNSSIFDAVVVDAATVADPGWVEPLRLVLVEPVVPPTVAAFGGQLLLAALAVSGVWMLRRRA